MQLRPESHATAYERHAPDPRVVDRAIGGSRQKTFWLEDIESTRASHERLRTRRTCDLAIVGGGYLGLWSAVRAKLRDPGRRVVLLEAHQVGWAASGRNGGFCEASITHGEENGRARWPREYSELERFGRENLDAFEGDVRDLQLECQWERTGTLSVAVEDHQRAWIEGDPGFVGAEAARKIIDSPLILGGLRQHESALIHPARLALELARVACELGVETYETSPVIGLESSRSRVRLRTDLGMVDADQVVLATNVFPSLLRRNRLHIVPVYDYVLMTEPLSSGQMNSIGWSERCGLADMANQFHYSRLTADNRILYGGYDAIYHRGRRVREEYEDRPQTYRRLAAHFFATFPQLIDVNFSHRWAGAIDTCTQFTAFYGLARGQRVAYAAGFTGLGVGATRFAAEVVLDLLEGRGTERTRLQMVRRRPLPFPPEPLASIGINLTRWALDQADHRQGHRNLFLRSLDAIGLGFDS